MKKKLLITFVLLSVMTAFNLNAQSFNTSERIKIDTSRINPYLRSCEKKELDILTKADQLLFRGDYKKAMKLYKKLERKNPDAYLFKKIGDVNMLHEKYNIAAKYYNKAITVDDKYEEAYRNILTIYVLQNNTSSAIKHLKKMKDLFPEDVSITFALMAFYISSKEYEKVVLNIAELLKKGSGQAAHKAGDLLISEWCELLKNLDKNEIENTPGLSEYMIHAMNNSDTDVDISAIVEQYPENSIAAKLYILKSRNCFRNRIALKSLNMLERRGLVTEWQYWRFGMSAAKQRDWKASLDYYSKAIEKNEKVAWLFQNRGEVRRAMNDAKGGIEDMTKAISLADNVARFYIRRGNAYRRIRRNDKALEDYIKASKLKGGERAFITISSEYLYRGKYNLALQYAEKAIVNNPTNAFSYIAKGDVYSRLKNYDKAVECFEIAQSLDKTNKFIERKLIHAFKEKKDYAGALSAIKDAETKYNDSRQWLMDKCDIYIKMKEYERCFELLKKAKADITTNSGLRDREEYILRQMQHLSYMCKDNVLRQKIKVFVRANRGNSYFGLTEQAREAERNRDYRKAVGLYNKIIESASGIKRFMAMRNKIRCMERYLSIAQIIKEYDVYAEKYPEKDWELEKARYLLRKNRLTEGMSIVERKMKEGEVKGNFLAHELYFRYTKSVNKCEEIYQMLLKKQKEGKLARGGNRGFRYAENAKWIHSLMSDVYERNNCYKKTLMLLDTIEKLDQKMYIHMGRPHMGRSFSDSRKARLYLKMGDKKKWFDYRYKEYLSSNREFYLNNLMTQCLRNGMMSELNMLRTKHTKGNKKYNHYCWLDIYPLMKENKFKEAEVKFKQIVSKYSKNERMLDSIYCDILDLCNGLKNMAYKKFIMGLNSDILFPVRGKFNRY